VTMLIARWTHESSLIEATRQITDTHVSAGIRAAQLSDLPKHEQTLARIRSLGRHARRVAVRVTRSIRLSRGLNSKIASDTLRALRDAGIIEQHASPWQVTDPLLRNFLTASCTASGCRSASARGGLATPRSGRPAEWARAPQCVAAYC